jgi:hypothetical protein
VPAATIERNGLSRVIALRDFVILSLMIHNVF